MDRAIADARKTADAVFMAAVSASSADASSAGQAAAATIKAFLAIDAKARGRSQRRHSKK